MFSNHGEDTTASSVALCVDNCGRMAGIRTETRATSREPVYGICEKTRTYTVTPIKVIIRILS
jgi:hypothetical protein